MAHDDFAVEPVHGLEKQLRPGERMLWQGAPKPWALAKSAMVLHWVIGYFAFLAVWRGYALWTSMSVEAGVAAVLWYVILGALAAGIILAIAWVLARTTVYTITSARVVMRIGAALTVSLNLPLKHIASADLGLLEDGTGSIHLKLKGGDRFSYLVLWPHVRPWHAREPEPTLRCIPEAEKVARILAEAAQAEVGAVVGDIQAEPAAAPFPGPAHPVPAE